MHIQTYSYTNAYKLHTTSHALSLKIHFYINTLVYTCLCAKCINPSAHTHYFSFLALCYSHILFILKCTYPSIYLISIDLFPYLYLSIPLNAHIRTYMYIYIILHFSIINHLSQVRQEVSLQPLDINQL